jgi:hypothetical protein
MSDWFGLGGVIIAAVAIPVTIFSTRRWGTRPARIRFSWETTPLLPAAQLGGGQDAVKVTYCEIPVSDPHLFTLRLVNIGPTDITRAHFDGGDNLLVQLNSVMYGVIKTTHPAQTISPAIGAGGSLELAPVLLKRGEAWIVEAILSGEPRPVLHSPLSNTDIALSAGEEDPIYGAFLATLGETVFRTTVAGVPVGAFVRSLLASRSSRSSR